MIPKTQAGLTLLLFVGLLFSSCEPERFVYHEYKGVTITQLDQSNNQYIYYGWCDNDSVPCSGDSYIHAHDEGLNFDVHGSLIFSGPQVLVVRSAGHFEKYGNDSLLQLIDSYEDDRFGLFWDDKLKSYDSITEFPYYLADGVNKRSQRSKVKVTYKLSE